MSAAGFDQLLAFADSPSDRLLERDILPTSHGVEGHRGMPVIGSGDHDRVDVVA